MAFNREQLHVYLSKVNSLHKIDISPLVFNSKSKSGQGIVALDYMKLAVMELIEHTEARAKAYLLELIKVLECVPEVKLIELLNPLKWPKLYAKITSLIKDHQNIQDRGVKALQDWLSLEKLPKLKDVSPICQEKLKNFVFSLTYRLKVAEGDLLDEGPVQKFGMTLLTNELRKEKLMIVQSLLKNIFQSSFVFSKKTFFEQEKVSFFHHPQEKPAAQKQAVPSTAGSAATIH